MASLSRSSKGHYTLQFTYGLKRRTLRLGRIPKRNAEAYKLRVEQLVAARQTGCAPGGETARWLNEIDDSLYARLANLAWWSGETA